MLQVLFHGGNATLQVLFQGGNAALQVLNPGRSFCSVVTTRFRMM